MRFQYCGLPLAPTLRGLASQRRAPALADPTPARNPHLLVRSDWLALRREPALEPALPIVDPHHHFYDNERLRYFFFDLQDDLASGHNIVATVFMECRTMYRADGPAELRCVGETEFVAGMAAMAQSGKYGPCRVAA